MSERRRTRWLRRLLTVVVLAAGLASGGWYYQQRLSADAPGYQTSTVSRGELVQVVTASGQLDPMVKVEVGSQISGMIQKLLVDFNSTVKSNQIIAEIDPATYEANFVQAQGNLANAKAALELAQLNAERAKSLRNDKLNTQADYEKAMADLHQAEANVKINEGTLMKAQADLARCTIYAPIHGVVISRNVNVGQTVAASLSAPTLFVIGNDLTKMQIAANVAEADVGLVEVGQDAEFNVDAFPGKTFHGKVTQIRNAPKTEQNVVTYDTIIEVSNPDLKLKPGMTANVSIIVAHRDKALKIANAALRFRPPEAAQVVKSDSSSARTEGSSKSSKRSDTSPRKKDKTKSQRTVYLLVGHSAGTNEVAAGEATKPTLKKLHIKTGITDGTYTEVLEGLNEGDEVVTGLGIVEAKAKQSFNPFLSTHKRH